MTTAHDTAGCGDGLPADRPGAAPGDAAAAQAPWPPGDGAMARLVRDHDWAATPLGPIGAWPERLKGLVELVLSSPTVSSLACGPRRLLIYNDAAARLYDGRHPRALGRPLAETFPDSYPVVAPLYDRAFAGEAVHVPAQPLDVSGTGGEVFDAYLTPVRGTDGGVAWVHMTGFEISARLAAEQQRANEDRRSFLLHLCDTLRPLADPVGIEGEACRLLAERLAASRACYVEIDETTGLACVGRDFVRDGLASLAGTHRIADFGRSVEALRHGGCCVIADMRTSEPVPAADRPGWAALRIVACLGVPLVKGGRLVGALGVADARPRAWSEGDVTLLHEVGERIWTAVEQARVEAALREADRRKDEFLAVMSHELKNPLHLIALNAELLARQPQGTAVQTLARIAATIRQAVKSQAQLIDDLLDLSRMRTGKLSLHPEDMRPDEMVGRIVAAVRPDARARGLAMTLEVGPGDHRLHADPVRIEQIVWNLLSNALKFTPPGGAVRVVLSADAATLRLEVADTGQGIEADFLPHVFEMFHQADAHATTRRKGGLGIGLALVRRLVEAHGGQVAAASAGPGQGAVFTVVLPRRPAPSPPDGDGAGSPARAV